MIFEVKLSKLYTFYYKVSTVKKIQTVSATNTKIFLTITCRMQIILQFYIIEK